MHRFSTVLTLAMLTCATTTLATQCSVQPGAIPVAGQSVLTYHYDNNRSGLNSSETTLTQTDVNYNQFGRVAMYTLDGEVHAQPLIVTSTYNGAAVHALYAATDHDSVYRIDADTGTQIWRISVLGSGETTSPSQGISYATEQGIMATPVIDLTAGSYGAIYVVGKSVDSQGNYHQRLHALDLCTGAELFGGPAEITATYPGTGDDHSNGVVYFDPQQYMHRAGLLLLNGTIYTTWSSHGDTRPYTGWIMTYDARTLKQTAVLNLTPNGSEGAIWMGGSAPAADVKGYVYIVGGNGTFDTTFDSHHNPAQGDYGNTLFKMILNGDTMEIVDYYAPRDTYNDIANDKDYGSGGVILLPSMNDVYGKTWQLTVTTGKNNNLYLNDRNNLGKFNAAGGNVYQEVGGAFLKGAYGPPAYFNGTLYFCGKNDYMKAFAVKNARLSTSPIQTGLTTYNYLGAIPVVSANGTANGIVWAVEENYPDVLHAYKADDITQELYNSTQAPNKRDALGNAIHFIAPTVIAGKVFVPTLTGVAVFGLLK